MVTLNECGHVKEILGIPSIRGHYLESYKAVSGKYLGNKYLAITLSVEIFVTYFCLSAYLAFVQYKKL